MVIIDHASRIIPTPLITPIFMILDYSKSSLAKLFCSQPQGNRVSRSLCPGQTIPTCPQSYVAHSCHHRNIAEAT